MASVTDIEKQGGEVFADFYQRREAEQKHSKYRMDDLALATLAAGQQVVDRLRNLENLLADQKGLLG